MKYVDNFSYQITGNPQGHKLVFLHGLLGAGANWRSIAKAFEADFHVLVFDQRGHGRSFHPEDGYARRNYAVDIQKILDDLGWSEIALVGHSLGGRNALEFASLFSQRVKALVIEDIGPQVSELSVNRTDQLIRLVPTPFASRTAAREFFENEYPGRIAFHPQPDVISRFFLSNITEKPDGTHDWRFDPRVVLASVTQGGGDDLWHSFTALKMPTLVVRGENSKDLSAEVFERMMAVRPNTKGVEIPDAGHWVHFDQPDAFVQVLKEFFHSLLGTNL